MGQSFNAPYEAIGEELLSQLVDTFYERVKRHPLLYPIFPDDLTETARKQKQFLTQYLGGPPLYTEEHGHPMLRARHLPFNHTGTGGRMAFVYERGNGSCRFKGRNKGISF